MSSIRCGLLFSYLIDRCYFALCGLITSRAASLQEISVKYSPISLKIVLYGNIILLSITTVLISQTSVITHLLLALQNV